MNKPSFKDTYIKYVVWDDENINGFFGDYRFLSNFHLCDVYFEGMLYPSSEHAYMASKSTNYYERAEFSYYPPSRQDKLGLYQPPKNPISCKEARNLGQTIALRPNWEEIKYDMMLAIVFDKFWRNKDIQKKLIDTGDRYLEETNHWNDTYWGFSWQKNVGQNKLGKILMKVRECLK